MEEEEEEGGAYDEDLRKWYEEHGIDPNDADQQEELEHEESEISSFGKVEDADWDLARGDFTKAYNRSRQLARVGQQMSGGAVNQSKADGSTQGNAQSRSTTAVPLPAMNRAGGATSKAPPPKAHTGRSAADVARSSAPSDAASSVESCEPPRIVTLQTLGLGASALQPSASTLSSLSSRLQILQAYDPSSSAGGALSTNVPRKGALGVGGIRKVRDKSDRATKQQVLDPRTLTILFKMLNKGTLERIDGVVSTGKEANVYHATTPAPARGDEVDDQTKHASVMHHPSNGHLAGGGNVALKIFKTSILVFKDRDRYVSGEFRFRHGYARHNPRKMVKMWAEKEARNLKRLVSAGIRCPRPIELRDHVLVMQFLGGKDGWASPRLKDAEELVDQQESGTWERLYRECVTAMRVMYHACHLVHADLSEYNVLYHDSHLYIIDVGQSVEHDHPSAFDFLRADISHVDDYFKKRGGVKTLGLRRTFDWIIRNPAGRRSGGRAGLEKEGDDYDNFVRAEDVGNRFFEVCQEDQKDPRGDKILVFDRQGDQLATTAVPIRGPFATIEVYDRLPGESDEQLLRELEGIMDKEAELDDLADSALELSVGGASTSARAHPRHDEKESDEAVFKSSYIPRTLDEVYDPERDTDIVKAGGGQDLIYANVTGLPASKDRDYIQPNLQASSNESEDEGSEDESSSDDEGHAHAPRGHRHEDRDAKKERKNAVKEAQREKRKSKMPKKVKEAHLRKKSGKRK
ncbi:RIO1-domain-containing protein [Ceraceosorus guamensis]|uniref:Serine/threonine-protein kinase RIO1 n=1 Tax=Ceraceosorus guamensis TaxID=1522189 RepID=A0A316VP61_9BASI|nr:RIO1-domain-containing protein [Ceraceosorus guamensis]PWN39104.1 RIO1-domain-containing protein [Ceraceosorus guamensis]